MAAPVTDTERTQIIAAIESGKSARAVAADFGRSTSTISAIAREIGWTFGQTNAARAREARSAYSAEKRAELAARITEEVERLLDDLRKPHLAFNFGGKDNTYEEHQMAEPPVEAKRALMQTIRDGLRTVIDIDRHDNRAEDGLAAVDQWLRGLVGDEAAA